MPVDSSLSAEFTTAKRKAKPIKFTIDGDTYTFTAPKQAVMAMPLVAVENDEELGIVALRSQFDWLDQGLPEDQAKRLRERLNDPDDDFDLENLEHITEWLMEKVSGRPTG